MTKEERLFYEKNQEFIEDIKDYQEKIQKEFYHVINEVSGHTLKGEGFNIGMIPFETGINGILVNDKKSIKFECNDIRAEIGTTRHSFMQTEYEGDLARDYNYPFIRRHGGYASPVAHELVETKMKSITNNNALFVSNWIEFGAFCVFFTAGLNEQECLKYWDLTDTGEDNKNSYKYFLNTLIDNFFEKWLEFVYYGLSYSTINYISDSQAIITASANDMFESRQMPTEHLFTKLANCEYEGISCRGKIVFTDNLDISVRLKKPVKLSIDNIKKIRKILEMSNEKICLIATISTREIIGLDAYENNRESYMLKFIDANMWELSRGGKYIIKYINGQYRLPGDKFARQIFLNKCEERFEKNYDKNIANIIEEASCQKHGTMVIVSVSAKEECQKLVAEGKGTAIYEKNLIKENRHLILGLCSIDGALMIDPFGNCFGIGLILANANSGKGNPERGARYNSAVNYINHNKHGIAVVISEDGMIDIL